MKFNFREEQRQSTSLQNFTLRPVHLSQSIGSRLKQSFAQINRSTPVESLSEELLIEEVPEHTKQQRRKTAILVGASVGAGAFLLGFLLIGGTLLFTSGDESGIIIDILNKKQVK